MAVTAPAPPTTHRVSVVIPCLDEAETIAECVARSCAVLDEAGFDGEVIVVDNGSTDRSVAVAREAGATVVHEPRRGYGRAYLTGIDQARGFQPTPQAFQFGVCATASSDPHCTVNPATVPKAMDVITPAGVLQSDELDYTKHNPVVLTGVVMP